MTEYKAGWPTLPGLETIRLKGTDWQYIQALEWQLSRALDSRQYVPDVDGERYRAIRDKGIAFSAWQDENGVQWAVNGRVGKDLDALVDEELLKRGISPETTK